LDFYRLLENKKFQGTAVITAAVFFILVLFLWDPAKLHYYPPCLFQSVTGLLCPGCGGMRGTHQLLHLHFLDAFNYNPLVYISTPVIIYSIIYYFALLVFKKHLPKVPVNGVTVSIASGLVALFWILRNL
jgi:flagellar biosynthesis protein FliR